MIFFAFGRDAMTARSDNEQFELLTCPANKNEHLLLLSNLSTGFVFSEERVWTTSVAVAEMRNTVG